MNNIREYIRRKNKMAILAKWQKKLLFLIGRNSLNSGKIFVIFAKEDISSILIKFESEFLWIISIAKHKARDIWDRHISAKLPTQKGHSFFHTTPKTYTLHGKLTFLSNASALLRKVVIIPKAIFFYLIWVILNLCKMGIYYNGSPTKSKPKSIFSKH